MANQTTLTIVTTMIAALMLCATVPATTWTPAPAPQNTNAKKRSKKVVEAERREVLSKRTGRYTVRGEYDLSLGRGPNTIPVQMEGDYEVQAMFEGQVLLERSISRFPGQDPTTSWSLFSCRRATNEYWSISFDASRTPFMYLAGLTVDDEVRLADPARIVYSNTAFKEKGRWKSTFGFKSAKRPIFTLAMTPSENIEPVEILAATIAGPLLPKNRNRKRNDKDTAKNWHEEHELLAKFAGDFEDKRKKVTVHTRVICAGRFLLWISKEDGLLSEVAITGFDGPQQKFSHWRVPADQSGPHAFTGTYVKERLSLNAFLASGEIQIDIRKPDIINIKRRGTGGNGRLKLQRKMK